MFNIDKLKELFIKLFLQCKHKRTSFPQAPKGGFGYIVLTHVTCLDCGKEMKYDWEKMEICQ